MAPLHFRGKTIDQFRYIKIQLQTKDSMRLWGINTEFVGLIPQSLVLRSIVRDWILIYRNWSIKTPALVKSPFFSTISSRNINKFIFVWKVNEMAFFSDYKITLKVKVTEVPVGIWIRDKFKLKIDRSLKTSWREYGVVTGSQWWAPGPLMLPHERPRQTIYSYTRYWTGTSLQWRLVRGNINKKR